MAGINPATGQFDPYYYGSVAPANENQYTTTVSKNGTFKNTLTYYNIENPGGSWSGTASSTPAATPTTTSSPVDPAQAYYDWLKAQQESALKRQQDSLISVMREFMASNGMTELLAGVEKYVRLGYSGDAAYFMVKNDPAYKAAYAARFAANSERAKLGLPELSPATYIEMEQGYRTAMLNRGFPTGLFDSPSDFTALISRDVSVSEVERRLDEAVEYINFDGNAAVRQQLRDIYGMTDQQMAAYVLDPTRTLDYLQRENTRNLTRASVGGAAANTGVTLVSSLRDQIAEMMNGADPTSVYASSSQKFTEVAEQTPLYQRLAAYSGEVGTTDELVQEQFSLSGAAEVTNKKKVLASQERARFSGLSGLGSSSLSSGRKAQ
jgi:hypothetical protein